MAGNYRPAIRRFATANSLLIYAVVLAKTREQVLR